MKYHDLKHRLEALVVFTLRDVFLLDPDFRQATLYDWEKLGKVVRLKNGCYTFSDLIPVNFDFYLLANLIYEPSYVSTEMALNHYGVIPELVSSVTCVTTNKTQVFANSFGNFVYQTIAPALFFGYDLLEVREHGVKIASLEKAVLDYLYFNSSVVSNDDFSGLRWNKQILNEGIDKVKLNTFLAIFANAALAKRVTGFYKYLET
jgi:predicted transcriptional regulator of viral defense system